MKTRMQRRLTMLGVMATHLFLAIVPALHAQSKSTVEYYYDDRGRLIKVLDGSGNVATYNYDSVGNLASISRSALPSPDALAILNFTPNQGPIGQTVTIQGQGFSATPGSNIVQFNGTAATVSAATPISLTVTVPSGATTGPISVAVGTATATTSSNFTVLQIPTVTSVTPNLAFQGTTVSNFQVTGLNLTGTTFAFAPSFVPPAIVPSSVSINAAGTSATMTLTVDPSAVGTLVLVGTNSSGSSSQIPGANNTFTVLSTLPSADADGDGLTNIYEQAINSNPANPSTTGDGIPDGWALFFGLSPLDPTGGSKIAPDGLTFLQAFQRGLNPLVPTLVPPTVSMVLPANGATNYPTNGAVIVRFDEALQVPVALTDVQIAINAGLPAQSTFSSANAAIAAQVLQGYLLRTCCGGAVAIPNTVQVFQGSEPVPGFVRLSNDGLSLVFDPVQPFSSSTTYTVRVQNAKAASGAQMTGAFQSTFTTGLSTSLGFSLGFVTSPSNGATDVPTNSAIQVQFGGQVDPSSVTPQTFVVTDLSTGQTLPGMIQVDPLGFSASFVPQRPYGVGRTIIVQLLSGIQSLTQGAFQPTGFTFTTTFAPDSQGPTSVGVSPANGATGLPLNSVIVLQFNEPLNIFSVLTGLHVQAGTVDVPGAIALSDGDKRVTFTPQAPLLPNTVYSIGTTATITDVADKPMVNPGTTTFTTGAATDTTTLTVTEVSPLDGALAVPTNAVVQVRFSKPIDPLTASAANFQVAPSIPGATTGPPIAGTVAVAPDALSATFTPSAPLLPSTGYFFNIFGLTDLEGQQLNNGIIGLSGFGSSFTTGTGPQAASTVTAVSPPNGSTAVPINTRIVVQLSAPANLISVGASAITVSAGGTPVVGTISVSNDATTLTFVPTNLLAVSTTYSVRVAGFTDAVGNAVVTFTSSFSTSGMTVTTAPSVVSVNPASGATGVAVNTKIVLTFSEPINPITVNNSTVLISLSVPGFRGVIAGAYSVDATGTVVTFTPVSPFPANTTVFVGANGVMDFAGNSSEFSSSFTTGSGTDTTAPTVLSVAPANGATNVGLNSAVVLTFSKSLLNGSINSNTFALFVNGSVIANGGSARISADNRTVTLSAGTLPSGSIVTVVVTSGVVDLSGNHLADFSSQFTTASADTTNPSVVSQRPAFDAFGVPLNMNIVLFLSEPMNVTTLNGALHVSQNGVLVNGTTQISDSGQVIQFTPSSPWANDALVQVFLDSTAQDVDGRSFFGSYEGSFRTVADTSTTPPSVTGTSLDNVAAVPTNAPILVGFNEALNPATVNTTTVQLQNQMVFPFVTIPSAVSLVGGGIVIQLTPNAALAANTFYSVAVSTGLQGTNGLAFVGNTLGSFTTGGGPDTTAPVVVSVAPPDGSVNIGDNAIIRVRFSKPIDPLTVSGATIQVTGANNTAIQTSFSFDISNQDVLLVPQSVLPDGARMTIGVSGVMDAAGNSVVPSTTHFTVGAGPDTTPPVVISQSPFSLATNVPLNAPISFQTNEPMDPGTVNSKTIPINDNTTFGQVAGTYSVSANGQTASFVPSAPLAPAHSYGGTSSGITDLEGNLLSGPFFGFTTGTAETTVGPTVVGVSPPTGLTGVPINARVLIQFDEPVDSLTLGQVTLSKAGVSVTVIPTLSNANQMLMLVPVVPLSANTVYTVSVTGVQDLAGNPLTAPSTTTFTTGPGADLTLPAFATTTPTDGATGVPLNTTIQVQFNKRIDLLTITSSTFYLSLRSTNATVAGTVTFTPDGLTATFTPSAPLLSSTAYIANISGVSDLVGQQVSGFINFTTGP